MTTSRVATSSGRLRTALFLMLSLVASAACASGRAAPGDVGYPYNVGGAYDGRVRVGDEAFDATLRVRTSSGGRVSGALSVVAPIEIEGAVQGHLVDELLRVTITYRDDDGCDGRIEGILTVTPGADQIEGPVTIFDCGDPIAATMSFHR